MRKKITGLPQNLDFNPLFTRFNCTEFLHTQAWIQRVYREERTSKHGISIVLNLEYQRRDAFLAAIKGKTDYHIRAVHPHRILIKVIDMEA